MELGGSSVYTETVESTVQACPEKCQKCVLPLAEAHKVAVQVEQGTLDQTDAIEHVASDIAANCERGRVVLSNGLVQCSFGRPVPSDT